MEPVGSIVRLQVQEASLKVGQAPRRRYEPGPLRTVPRLSLDDGGVRGWTEAGKQVPDVHHRDHPASKNRRGTNGISVCFTSHYGAMRERFGDHLRDGLAGENILVATATMIDPDHLRAGVAIQTADGALIRLEEVIVAAPSVEFARFALRFPEDARPDRTVTESLAFLDGGMRGYYATYRGEPAARVSVGDRVVLPPR